MTATLGASGIEGGTENNQTRHDRAFGRDVRPRESAGRGKLQPSRFYDALQSEPDLPLSRAKGPRGLQIQLSIFISKDQISPTITSYPLKIEKLLPEELCDRWCVSNVALFAPLVGRKSLDSFEKIEGYS